MSGSLKIGVLASERSWYFRDLERAASARRIECHRLEFARLVATVNSEMERFHVSDPAGTESPESSRVFDSIIVRSMPPGSLEQVIYRMNALARWESTGVGIFNSPRSLECAVDKYLTTARLRAVGLRVPETVVCEHEDDAMMAFQSLGGDVVVKPLFGAEGRGIVRVTDPDLAHRTFRTLMRLNSVLYLQRYVDHGGFDTRILTLNGRVLGGMRRHSPNDFRTNVARQAIAEAYQPTDEEAEMALKSAAATGTFVAGIDLLQDRDRTNYVIEVNAVPGWQAFARVNQIDVADHIIEAISICRHDHP